MINTPRQEFSAGSFLVLVREIMPDPFKSSRSLRAGLLVLTLVGLLASAAHGRPKTFKERTAHYLVKTDISPAFARIVASHMEEIFAEYSRRFKDYGRMKDRFNVAVFGTEQEYLKAVPPQVKGSTGVFVSYDFLLAAHHQDRTDEEVLRTLYHEGFHQFMYHVVSRDCPVWLNEGLAEYFSEATWNGQGFTTGQVPTMRLHTVQKAIAEGRYIPLRDLFAMDATRWLQNVRTDSHRADLHYSQAWSVAHFLIHAQGGRYAGMLDRFLREISEREDPEEAFRVSFETDAAAFERVWAQYVMSLRPSPKFRCRDNMEALMLLAKLIYRDRREFESVPDLRRGLLRRSRYRWEITRPTGERIASDQTEEVAKLFRCPYHQGDHGVSYVLVRHIGTSLPMLVCDHHPGVIIKAYYRQTPAGDLKVQVEEQVRETVSEDLRRAIMAAGNRTSSRK